MDSAEKPSRALRDFLYKDAARVTSFYSQIFGGLLASSEQTTSDINQSDRTVGFKDWFGFKRSKTGTESARDTFQPHDIIANDTIDILLQKGYVQFDAVLATHGSLVHAKGGLEISDSKILENVASTMADSSLHTAKGGHTAKEKHKQTEAIAKVIKAVKFPDVFTLATDKGHLLAGTFKSQYWEDGINSHVYRHSGHELPGVHIIGIKEVGTVPQLAEPSPLLLFGRTMGSVLSQMLFPNGSIQITPLFIYREIYPELVSAIDPVAKPFQN